METTLWSCGFHIIFQIWNFRTQETSPVSEMFSMTLNLHVQNMTIKTYLNKGELGACKNHSRIITIDWLAKIVIVVWFWCLWVVLYAWKLAHSVWKKLMPIRVQVMNLNLKVVVIFDLFLFIQKAWRNSQACCTCFESVSINVINVGVWGCTIRKLRGAQCFELVKSRVPSVGFLWNN